MLKYIKKLGLPSQNILIISILLYMLTTTVVFFGLDAKIAEAQLSDSTSPISRSLLLSGGNALLPISNPENPYPQTTRKISAIITAYSSTQWQTDDTPFITASQTFVRDGIVANNFLPFGTRIRIPELYGNKIFVVEDRMNWKKKNNHFDIWFSSYSAAKNFGVERTYIEILEI